MYVAGVSDMSRAFASSGNASALDERMQRLARHAGLSTRQRLELLVRLGQAMAPHHRLDRLGKHFPVGVEVGRDAARIDGELRETLPQPDQPSSACPSATPRLRSTVESVRSRCQRDTGSFSARCRSIALASPRLPSEFSKSIGLTLCGIVDEPTSPSRIRWRK